MDSCAHFCFLFQDDPFIKSSDINQKGIRIPINCYKIYYNENYEKYFWLPIQNKWFNKKLSLKQSLIGSICVHQGVQSHSTSQSFLPHLSHHMACKPSVLCWAPPAPCSAAPSRKAVPPFPSFLTPIPGKPNQNWTEMHTSSPSCRQLKVSKASWQVAWRQAMRKYFK